MNRITENLPTPIKLGLRDLNQNKLPTVVLILLIAAIIAAFLPPAMHQQTMRWHLRSAEIVTAQEYFAQSLEKENNPDLQAAWTFYAGSEAPDLSELNLQISQMTTGFISFPDFNAPEMEVNPEVVYATAATSAVMSADWSDPNLPAKPTFTQGRAPEANNEIALSHELLQHFPGMDTLAVGDTLTVGTDQFTDSDQHGTYTVVGLYDFPSSDDSQPTLVSYYRSSLLASETIVEDALLLDRYFAFGPPLSPADTQDLALAISNAPDALPDPVDWGIASLIDNKELRIQVASTIPLDSEFSGTSTPLGINEFVVELLLVAAGVLALITVISVPLYWQNSRRRKLQFAQLERNGVGRYGRLASRLVPALVIGLSAGALGLAGAIWRYSRVEDYVVPGSELPMLVHATALTITASFILGLFPPLVASFLAFAAERKSGASLLREVGESSELVHTPRGALQHPGPVAAIAGIAGITLILVSALAGDGEVGLDSWHTGASVLGMIVGLCLIVVAIYFGLAALLPHLSSASSRWPLAARIAAREVAGRLGSSISTIIPVAAIAGLCGAMSVIGRQHYLESREPTYASAPIEIAAYLLPVVLLVVFFSLLQSTEELRHSKSALSHQGVLAHEVAVIDGYRAVILTAVASPLGYLVGMFAGSMVLVYRQVETQDWCCGPGADTTFKVAALAPTLGTLIIVVVPLLLAFPIGWVAGRRNARLVAAT